jgi:ribosomal-protein-alanine N-acetyltransferase
MIPALSIQPLCEDHFQQAVEIHCLSLPEAWSKKSLQSTLTIANTFGWATVDETTSALLGFIIVRLLQDEAEIMTLAVHPEWRKKKIGSLLLNYMDTILQERNIQRIFLEVRSDNIAALKLYEGSGFRKVGERPHYYPSHKERATTAYVLAKHY